MERVTMQMIADRLGVSKALVSKALSNDPAVNDVTKNNIWSLAKEMGYRFKTAKSDRPVSVTGNIVVLMPSAYLDDFEYWGQVIRGIHAETAFRGITMMLAGIDIALPASEGMPPVVEEGKVDGVVALGHLPDSYIAALKILGIPFVMVDANRVDPSVDHVMANNYWGAWSAVQYLLGEGHRSLAFVGDPESAYSFRERKRGFIQAVEEFSASHPGEGARVCFIGGMGVSGTGNYVNEEFAATLQEHVTGEAAATAMFCANDMVAIEVLRLLNSWGIDCPGEVSVLGFDDLIYSQHISPQLTTMSVPRTEIGQKAVQLLFRRIESPLAITEFVLLPTVMVLRGSVQKR